MALVSEVRRHRKRWKRPSRRRACGRGRRRRAAAARGGLRRCGRHGRRRSRQAAAAIRGCCAARESINRRVDGVLVADSRGGESQRGDRDARSCPRQTARGRGTEAPSRTENKPRYLRCNLLTTTREKYGRSSRPGGRRGGRITCGRPPRTPPKSTAATARRRRGVLQESSSCFCARPFG